MASLHLEGDIFLSHYCDQIYGGFYVWFFFKYTGGSMFGSFRISNDWYFDKMFAANQSVSLLPVS